MGGLELLTKAQPAVSTTRAAAKQTGFMMVNSSNVTLTMLPMPKSFRYVAGPRRTQGATRSRRSAPKFPTSAAHPRAASKGKARGDSW
jgi:hypothetical protein